MIVQEIKRARAVGAPLVAITTADQLTTVQTIRSGLNGANPLVLWDIARGFTALNDKGQEVKALFEQVRDPMSLTDFSEAMGAADAAPDKTVVIAMNGHRFLEEPRPVQAVMNLRDTFKANRRTLILLGPDFRFPAELSQDFLVIDEPLPTDEQVNAILSTLYGENKIEADESLLGRATDALRGLASFPIEQAAALSVKQEGDKLAVITSDLWARKRKTIEQTRGLTMDLPTIGFDQMGGLSQAKVFAKRLESGPEPYRVIVFIDEIEKLMAGASGSVGDTSGVSQDQLKVLLTEMEKNEWTGDLRVGPPGSGKSMSAAAQAASAGVPLIELDLGAAKGSLVGQSEQQIRAAIKTILAIAGKGGAYFVGTCNQLETLRPELRRRFTFGVWFYDLPDADERESIGKLQTARYKLDAAPAFWRAADGWSGANIRDCCKLAYKMRCGLDEASAFIVPAIKQDPGGIERLRQMAAGRFLSASYPGPYRMPGAGATVAGVPKRAIMITDAEEQARRN